MSFLDYFRSNGAKQQSTAKLAKERLHIIVAHERNHRSGPDYLPQLERDILEVIRRYVDISPEQVNVQLDQNEAELSVLELNILLPEK
ncbi:cell division topological specificity factor MinE [Dongshaea marina]|uniref:cell division topological specificity factor MinE n=1 Tax=Dongshaea marina TaxID=2047966 RepID=UPI000D3E6C56|nr:cell division topological specificity factor MinE [Dongshaea marina]